MSFAPLLAVHIGAGSLGLLSGSAAMCFRKGSPRHVFAGRVFVGAMLLMAGAAVWLAVLKGQTGNVVGGLLTFYMVTTGWLAVRRGDGMTDKVGWAMLVIPVGLGSWVFTNGLRNAFHGVSSTDGVPNFMNLFIGSVMLLAAAGDLRVLLGGGVFGTKRLVRHLWRMSFGLFIASGSFFLGPSNRPLRLLSSLGLGRYLSPALFATPLYMILTVLPFLLMIFWLVRVRFTNTFKAKSTIVTPAGAA
jgi:hypothetical protein